jgi:hypothetical protein
MRLTTRLACICFLAVPLTGCGRPTHHSVFDKSLGLLREVRGVLQDVTDESSAKAAVEKLKAVRDKNDAINAELESLNPRPTREEQQSVKNTNADYIDLLKDIHNEETRIRRFPALKVHLDEWLKWLDKDGSL